MQSFLKWLGNLVFTDAKKAPRKSDLRATGSHLRTSNIRHRTELLAPHKSGGSRPLGAAEIDDLNDTCELYGHVDIAGRIEDAGPGKNILRSRMLREDTGTHETLKIIDAETDKPNDDGFDPYNTGQFDRSANWSRHSRK